MEASSEILDLEELFGQDLTDDNFFSTNVNMSSLNFVIDKLVRGLNGLNNWKVLKYFLANYETFVL